MRTSKVLFWAILLVVYAFNLPAADAKTSGNDVKHHHKQKIAKQKVGDNKAEEVEVLDAMVPYTSTQQFQKDVLQSASPVLVDFSATWCAPCRAMAPSVHNLAVKYSGKLKVYKIDIDDDEDLADDLKVDAVPTFMIFNGGKILKSETGNIGASKLNTDVSEVLVNVGAVSTAEKGDGSAY